MAGALATYNLAKRVVSAFSHVMYYGYQAGLIDYKCERAATWWQEMISTVTGWNCFAPVKRPPGAATTAYAANSSFVVNVSGSPDGNSSGMAASGAPSNSSGAGGAILNAVTQAWSSFTNWLFGR